MFFPCVEIAENVDKPEELSFLTKVAGNRQVRTTYKKKLSAYSHKIVLVISTCFFRTGESLTLRMQADAMVLYLKVERFVRLKVIPGLRMFDNQNH